LRIIAPNAAGVPELKAEFTPAWWVCDPCNRSERRYEVTYRSDGEGQYFPWYQIVTTDDTGADITLKLDYYREVIAAQRAMTAAAAEYQRLTGCGWSATLPAQP
jgi:hypothetical protein